MQFITLKLFKKPFYAVDGNTNWCTIPAANPAKYAQNLKIYTLVTLVILLIKFILRIKLQPFYKLSYRYDCCNTVYNRKNWEMTIMFNKIGLIKVHYAILYNGIWVKHLKQ